LPVHSTFPLSDACRGWPFAVMAGYFSPLPTEISLLIFSFLEPEYILSNIAPVSCSFHALSKDDILWQSFSTREGLYSGNSADDLTEVERGLSWQQIYIGRCNSWDPVRTPYNAETIFSDRNRIFKAQKSNQNQVVFCRRGFSSGIHYWENEVLHRQLGDFLIGVCWMKNVDCTFVPWLASSFSSVSYNQSGSVYFSPNGKSTHPFKPYAAGDTIGILFDADRARISFFVNGVFQVTINGLPLGETFYPAASVYYAEDGVRISFKQPRPDLLPYLDKNPQPYHGNRFGKCF